MVRVAGPLGSTRQWKKVMACSSGGDRRRWRWSMMSQLGGGTVAQSERRLLSVDRRVAVKEQRRSWSKMATEKLTMENRRFASPGSVGKRDKGNGVGHARRQQVATVGQ
jgi:hypothetical protein